MPGGWYVGEAVRPGVERAPGPRGSLEPLPTACQSGPARVASAALGRGSQPSARRSVRPAVRRLPRAAGERAKLAHLSPAGAASTFKSRSSFSFTFCLLPGRARLTWGRAPPPIGCARRGGGRRGSAPSSGPGREQAAGATGGARGPESPSLRAGSAPRKLESGRWHLRGSNPAARQPGRSRLRVQLPGLGPAAAGPRAFYCFNISFALEKACWRLTLALGITAAPGVPARFLELGARSCCFGSAPRALAGS